MNNTFETWWAEVGSKIRSLSGDKYIAEQGFKASVPQWYPIESAPGDGTPILGFFPSNLVGRDDKICTVRGYESEGRLTWYHCAFSNPTHWMPLPPHPTTTTTTEESA